MRKRLRIASVFLKKETEPNKALGPSRLRIIFFARAVRFLGVVSGWLTADVRHGKLLLVDESSRPTFRLCHCDS
jgi:hypothetical protein